MKHRAIWRVCLVLLSLLIAPLARGAEPAGETAQKLFCWKVTGPEGGVVYLLGTIHVGRADLYPLAPVIETSFKQADTLVTETDLIEPQDSARLLKLLMQKGTYPIGDSVENHIGGETRAHLARYIAATKELAGDYTHLKPWFLSVAIAVIEAKRVGLNTNEGMDRHFVDQATAMKKPIGTLETSEFQLDLMNSFSDELQDQLLLAALLDTEKKPELMDQLLQAWKSGNAEALHETTTRYLREYPVLKPLFAKMFDQRNDAMTQQIEQFLKTPKTTFVAVGAGHLTGERGILSQLRGKNYDIEQLHDKGLRSAAALSRDPD
jgi:uncharacterized protein YbaP (TraB family)